MKKQLLFIIDSLDCGGAEKSLVSLLSLINYDKYEVDLILFGAGGILEKQVPEEVTIIDYKHKILFPKTLISQLKKLYCHILLSPQLRLNKKRHGSEIHWRTIKHVYPNCTTYYDAAIAYQQGVPSFFLVDKVKARKKIAWINANIFADKYDMTYCEPYYQKIDDIIAVSDKLSDIISTNLPSVKEKVSIIYDCINPDQIKCLADEPTDDIKNNAGVSIVTVGRLSGPKNHFLAVDTAKALKEKGLVFRWYFVGEGELHDAIKEKINNYHLENEVIMLGLKENPYPYIKNADIYVQTSSYEGFCITLAEARILLKPIVSTNFDVVYDQIVDYQNGLIADMNPESVASKVLELINNQTLRQQIIENLKKEKNTTSKTEIEKFYQLIES